MTTEPEFAHHGPSAKYVLLYDSEQRIVGQALDKLHDSADDHLRESIEQIRQHLAWVPRPSYKHTFGIQVSVLDEGEDEAGYYKADNVEVDPSVAIGAVIDQLGRTESGLGFEANVVVGDEPMSVKFEWNGGFHLEPRWDV